MNARPHSRIPDLPTLNALHDQARLEAEALRRAAIDDFWRGADAVLATAATQARRTAQRLAHRLQRRALQQHLG